VNDPELTEFATRLFGLARTDETEAVDTARMSGHDDFLTWFGA
jgi:hypothetical protein